MKRLLLCAALAVCIFGQKLAVNPVTGKLDLYGIKDATSSPNGADCSADPKRLENYQGTVYSCQGGAMAALAGEPGPAMDINALTEQTAPTIADDFVAIHDAGLAALRKVKLVNLGFVVSGDNAAVKTIAVTPLSDALAGAFRRNSAGQTANIVEFQTEANAALSYVDKTGKFNGPVASANVTVSATGAGAPLVARTHASTVATDLFMGVQDGSNNTLGGFLGSGKLSVPGGTVYDPTASTGMTQLILRAGAGQAANKLMRVFANDGTTELVFVGGTGAISSSLGMSVFTGVTENAGMLPATGFVAGSNRGFAWSSSANYYGTVDTAIHRVSAGVVEIDNGTPGTYRDLILRNLKLTGVTNTPLASDADGDLIAATAAGVVGLFDSGTCAAGEYLKGDGTCDTPAGGTVAVQNDGSAVGSRATVNLQAGIGLTWTGSDTGVRINMQPVINDAIWARHAQIQAGAPLLLTLSSSSGTNFVGGMNPALVELTNGMVIPWTPNQTCSGTVRLKIDGRLAGDSNANGPKVYEDDGTTAATCTSGKTYQIRYETALDSAAGGFRKLAGASGGSGTVNNGTTDQIAYYDANGTTVSGTSTPNLGTPSAAVLTNATGLPISTGVAGLGAGVAAMLAITPNAANGPAKLDANARVAAAQMPALTGDATTTAGTVATTVGKVNGVTYPASPSTDAVPVVTAANTVVYKVLPDCDDPAAAKLLYDAATHAFSCGTDQATGTGGNPGGNDTEVQFKDGTTFGGDPGMTYNKTTNVLTVAGGVIAPSFTAPLGTAFYLEGAEQAKPAAPESGLGCWADSTDHQLECQNSAGVTVGQMIPPALYALLDGVTSDVQTQLDGKAASNASTAVNGVSCALGGSCTVTAVPTAPSTTVLGGVKSGQCTATTEKLMGYDANGDRICETDQSGSSDATQYFCPTITSAATDSFVCSTEPSFGLTVGKKYGFIANTNNSLTSTIKYGTLAAMNIVKKAGGPTAALANDDIRNGQVVWCTYDGTNCQLEETAAVAALTTGSTTSAGTTIGSGAGAAPTADGRIAVNTTDHTLVYGSNGITMVAAPTVSPSFTTPTLGAATATSINKVAITAPASSATLTIADGKTLTANNTLTFTGTDSSSVAFGTGGTVSYSGHTHTAYQTSTLGITIDGGGSAITTGVKGYIVVPFACTIQTWSLVADQSGSIVIDVWKHTAVPSAGNTITASAKPTLSSAQLAVAQATTGWTTTVSANDVLGFNVDSATTVQRATLTIACQR